MRTETEVIQVKNDPQIINEVNTEAAIWGWSVLNIQITDQKFVREGNAQGRENAWGDKYIVTREVITEHISYATITYQRDLDDPTIKRLADLENAYVQTSTADLLNDSDRESLEGLRAILNKKDRYKRFGKLSLIAAGICFILYFINSFFEIPFFIFVIAAIILYGNAFLNPTYITCQRNYNHIIDNLRVLRFNRKKEILAEAKAIHTT